MRHINLDLDGVFVDFYSHALAILGRPYASMTGAQAWGILDKVPHLFRDIPPLHDAKELWEGVQAFARCEGAHPRVLSALPMLTNRLVTAPMDKLTWVRRDMDSNIPVLLVDGGLAKTLAVAPGDILIDDLARNINAWRAAGGIGILHTSAKTTLVELARLART